MSKPKQEMLQVLCPRGRCEVMSTAMVDSDWLPVKDKLELQRGMYRKLEYAHDKGEHFEIVHELRPLGTSGREGGAK